MGSQPVGPSLITKGVTLKRLAFLLLLLSACGGRVTEVVPPSVQGSWRLTTVLHDRESDESLDVSLEVGPGSFDVHHVYTYGPESGVEGCVVILDVENAYDIFEPCRYTDMYQKEGMRTGCLRWEFVKATVEIKTCYGLDEPSREVTKSSVENATGYNFNRQVFTVDDDELFLTFRRFVKEG